MFKIAAMGDKDSVFGYASIGVEAVAVSDAKSAVSKLRFLAENNYAVIFITESLAAAIQKEIDKYKDAVTPAIILIPGVSGNTGDGMKNLQKIVEQAVGSDILS